MLSSLSPGLIISIIVGYFTLLLTISWVTSRDSGNDTFFLANRQSHWFLVAFGMIGASLSGVSFISIPGVIGRDGLNTNYSYMQMVVGYLLGYMVIAQILLPLYYRYNLTTIYEFLGQRLGWAAHKTGSAFFILSRMVGASLRLFLVAIVLQVMIMDHYSIPFWATVVVTIGLIWVYTFRGGIKTIVITDTLQTFFMLAAVVITIWSIASTLDLGMGGLVHAIKAADLGQVFYFDNGWSDPNNFFKQVCSGALITIVMTGLDQDMMQKNLTCRSIGDAQKNMFTFSVILIFANFLFISLGALLYIYSMEMGIDIPEQADKLYPTLALDYLPAIVGVFFLIGLLAAAYSSADSALTALTTSFCVDFLNFEKRTDLTDRSSKKIRFLVHLGFSFMLVTIVLIFHTINSGSVINDLFIAAGYTYGPILALFCLAIWTRRRIKSSAVIAVSISSPLLAYVLNEYSVEWFGGLEFGFLILPVNALIAFVAMYLLSGPHPANR